MTKPSKSLPLAAALVALFALGAFANSADARCGRRIDRTERAQQTHIGRGIARGSITPREAVRLEREQARIHRTERRARRDGTLAAGECRHLAQLQQRAGRHIRRAARSGR